MHDSLVGNNHAMRACERSRCGWRPGMPLAAMAESKRHATVVTCLRKGLSVRMGRITTIVHDGRFGMWGLARRLSDLGRKLIVLRLGCMHLLTREPAAKLDPYGCIGASTRRLGERVAASVTDRLSDSSPLRGQRRRSELTVLASSWGICGRSQADGSRHRLRRALVWSPTRVGSRRCAACNDRCERRRIARRIRGVASRDCRGGEGSNKTA
jgi:hypothetical protein